MFDSLGITGNSLAALGASGHLRLLDTGADVAGQVDVNGGGDAYATLLNADGHRPSREHFQRELPVPVNVYRSLPPA